MSVPVNPYDYFDQPGDDRRRRVNVDLLVGQRQRFVFSGVFAEVEKSDRTHEPFVFTRIIRVDDYRDGR